MTSAADDEMVDRQSTTGSPDSGAVMDEDVFTCLQYQVFSDDTYSTIVHVPMFQCNQTFLGMVQMQYQARVDMVQFIDLLEKACIRCDPYFIVIFTQNMF